MSKEFRDKIVFENGERVIFERLNKHQSIEWAIRILQCNSSSFLETLCRSVDLKDLESLSYLVDGNGDLLEEYKSKDAFDLDLSRVYYEDLLVLINRLIDEHWPFTEVTQGWNNEYNFKLDISDAIIDLTEDQLSIKSKVKSRLLSELNKACPANIKFEDFGVDRLDNFSETIALQSDSDLRDCNLNQGYFSDSTVIPVLDYLLGDYYVYSSAVKNQTVLMSLISSGHAPCREYLLGCSISLTTQYGQDVDMVCENGEHYPLDELIEKIARDRNLEGDYYDQIKEEIFGTFKVTEYLSDHLRFEVEIDFSDLFE